jgi:hypothetical protein
VDWRLAEIFSGTSISGVITTALVSHSCLKSRIIQWYYYQDTIIKNPQPLTMKLVYSVMKSVYSMVDGNVAGARRGNTQDKVEKMLSLY